MGICPIFTVPIWTIVWLSHGDASETERIACINKGLSMTHKVFLRCALSFCLALASAAAHPQGAAIFEGADQALGSRLMVEHRCAACHAEKAGGDGSAIVIHSGIDDYRSDPAGNSGPRIACGVIRK